MKEDDGGFSKVIVALATIFYIVIICMSFAGLAATKTGTNSISVFTTFMKDYGSLIAGLPVLIAVMVAKQQLDAHREQHLATIKTAYKDELLALRTAEKIANKFKNSSVFLINIFYSKPQFTSAELEEIIISKSREVREAAAHLFDIVNNDASYRSPISNTILGGALGHTASILLSDKSLAAIDLFHAIEDQKKFLRQFMPDL